MTSVVTEPLTENASTGEPARSPVLLQTLLSNEFGLLALNVVAVAIFATALPGFTSPFSLFTLSRQIGIDTMIGLAMMAVIVSGGLDLSVGAIGASSAMAFGYVVERLGMPLALAIPSALALGALLGGINGAVIVRSGVHSFIITLASMSIFFGVMIYLTQAQAFNGLPAQIAVFGRMKVFGPVSVLLIVTLAVCGVLMVLYRLTRLGREILAAGANARAAELSGVPVGRTVIICHMLTGALAALAGLMLTARTGATVPSMAGHLGQDWLLPAFLAPVLGGTLLTGGRVSVIGTLLGATFVTVITSGLLLMRVSEFWVQAFLGFMLLAAVLIDRARHTILKTRGMV